MALVRVWWALPCFLSYCANVPQGLKPGSSCVRFTRR